MRNGACKALQSIWQVSCLIIQELQTRKYLWLTAMRQVDVLLSTPVVAARAHAFKIDCCTLTAVVVAISVGASQVC